MKIAGKIQANPSKSFMQRAVALSFLADTPTRIFSPSFAEDSLSAIELIKKLKCKVEILDNFIQITPPDKYEFNELTKLNCGESGLLLRMFAPILSLFSTRFELSAEGSLKNRQLFEIEDILKSLGVAINTNNNYPPLELKGPIRSGKIKMQGDKTSQFLTGLLIALPKLRNKTIIEVQNLVSKSYINMTIDLVRRFGGKVNWLDEKHIEILPSDYLGQVIDIEGDWSSAAVFLIAGAIAGEVTVSGLNLHSKQGDKAILDVIEKVGAKIELSFLRMQESNSEHSSFQEGEYSAVIPAKAGIQTKYMDSSVAKLPQNDNSSSVTVKMQDLKPFEYDAKDTPDLVPYLSILASNCQGKSEIHNVGRINLKESRRLELIMYNLSLLGIKNELDDDTLCIWGGKFSGGIFVTGNDHRLAMAGALAALTSEKDVVIDNTDCVKKSYPNFWRDFGLFKQ